MPGHAVSSYQLSVTGAEKIRFAIDFADFIPLIYDMGFSSSRDNGDVFEMNFFLEKPANLWL